MPYAMKIPVSREALTFSSGRLINQVYSSRFLPTWVLGVMNVPTSSLRRLETGQPSTVTSEDASVVTKHKISNQRFIKPTIPELNSPRNLSSAVARLRMDHFKDLCIQGLMHANSAQARSPQDGLERKFQEWGTNSGVTLIT
ncbi:hypothetical protein TNCV_3457661 [Trichonephila clavipes]|nr:hypothetical protein TNCV_3457661 [Trichonephila clavipes]